MTPFIQSLISNQAQNVSRIPIKEAVKPVNPVIQQPIPQTIPNPQTDQSHPIPQGWEDLKGPRAPPEIIMDKLPIQSKKTQKKLIQKEIKPQMPEPTPLHDKYKLPPGTFPLKIQKKSS